jgi:hypothetical protein
MCRRPPVAQSVGSGENELDSDTVTINDQNDPVFQTATLSTVMGHPYNFIGGKLAGLLGVAPITWDYSDT